MDDQRADDWCMVENVKRTVTNAFNFSLGTRRWKDVEEETERPAQPASHPAIQPATHTSLRLFIKNFVVECVGSKTCGAAPDPGLTWLGLAAPSSVPAQIGHQGSFWREREVSMETVCWCWCTVEGKKFVPTSVLQHFLTLLIVDIVIEG